MFWGNSKALNWILHGNVGKHDIFVVWQITFHEKGFENYKYLHNYIIWEKEQWETGHFKMFQGSRDTLFSGNGTFQNVSGEKGHFILWKRDILPFWNDFFLWESDHLSSGIRDILWETGHVKRDHLSSGKHPLGIGNLVIGF